ncbi:tRNA epoxyqueuosine(34) reductase QueG [Gynuella sunshinyii]|uniref:Epoxyqueuosine reductase n=1 Tax=Gynuella sunshinyii YC6258 TaxID=1445510 RepID=A0A0C5VVC3_9GAMM|nr:tRNA epoxyqueuosine(34) reductase QueG [Gynuella sunshinyii]AJQ94384.1 putative Fe-S protein [Gynuella sunshinyii YC6258]
MSQISALNLDLVKDQIKQFASELGFQACSFSVPDVSVYADLHKQHIDSGYHGTMLWLENNQHVRYDPRLLVDGVKTIVSVRMNYRPDSVTRMRELLSQPDKAYVARYALGRDYHKVMRNKLQTLGEKINTELEATRFRAFVDSAPVLERELAEQSGLGWIGKNTLLLNEQAGSWFFLGELFLTLELPPDPSVSGKHCGSCQQCLTECPTGAFVGAGVLDARKCISYLTIEHDGTIPESLRPLMGNRIYGCDDCQIVCPFTKFSQLTEELDYQSRHALDEPSLADLWHWNEQQFLDRMQGSPIRRIGYEKWTRNLAVAIGNSGEWGWVDMLLQKLGEVSPMVDEHIDWAAGRLRQQQPD